jgi:hypothetical protein
LATNVNAYDGAERSAGSYIPRDVAPRDSGGVISDYAAAGLAT